jgi:hypothetical protein
MVHVGGGKNNRVRVGGVGWGNEAMTDTDSMEGIGEVDSEVKAAVGVVGSVLDIRIKTLVYILL